MKKAKSTTKRRVKNKSIQIRISTKKGFGIITLFFIIFATIVLLINNSQNVNNVLNSEAATNYGQSAACKKIEGTCEGTGKTNGEYFPNLCPGPATWECFVSSATLQKGSKASVNYGQSAACKSAGGTCESTDNHPDVDGTTGNYEQNLCPGPATWQCWVSATAGGTKKATGGGSTKTTGVNTPCTTPRGNGRCELTSTKLIAGETFLPGFCPGPDNVECMVQIAGGGAGGVASGSCGAGAVRVNGVCLSTIGCASGEARDPYFNNECAFTQDIVPPCPVGEAICTATKSCLTAAECNTADHQPPKSTVGTTCSVGEAVCSATKTCLTAAECNTAVHDHTNTVAGGQGAVLNCVGGAGQPPCATPAPNPTVVIAAPITNTGGSNANASLIQQIISLLQQLQHAL
jgi:hypothetical protein